MNKLDATGDLVASRRLGARDEVQDDRQLVHASDQDHRLGLARGQQPGIDGLENGVGARANLGDHLQCTAHVASPAKDVALAAQGARIPIHRCQDHQRVDLLAVEPPQLGQLRRQRAGRGRPDTLNRSQKFRQIRAMGLDVDLQLTGHVVQLHGNGPHDLQDAEFVLGARHAQALALGHQHGHQLTPTGDDGGEFALLLIGQLVPLGVDIGGKAAQGLCVDMVDLGQAASAAGEVAGLARVDHRHSRNRRRQRQGQVLLVAACGLQHHPARRDGQKRPAQLSLSGLVIPQIQGLHFTRERHFEAGLGDINAYTNRFTHSSFLAPSFMNTKCVRPTIRDAAEQRDHHRAPCAVV
jgi:hypothetical protein